MKTYATQPEHISLTGLASAKILRRRVCASKLQKFAWLRFDTCTEILEGGARPTLAAVGAAANASMLFHETLPFAGRNREHFMVMCLDARNVPVGIALIAQGGRSDLSVDAGGVFQAVLLSGASAFIVAHNHPSGSLAPSAEDIELTHKLVLGAKLLHLRLLDHIILTDAPDRFFSLNDAGSLV